MRNRPRATGPFPSGKGPSVRCGGIFWRGSWYHGGEFSIRTRGVFRCRTQPARIHRAQKAVAKWGSTTWLFAVLTAQDVEAIYRLAAMPLE